MEITDRIVTPEGTIWDTAYRALDYDTATGHLDYAHIQYRDGREEATDFDSTTGLLDYRYITDPDGHSLSQDYDAAGRLDYEVERWADGRMTVTVHDLLDQHGWSIYSIAYNAEGAIAAVTVL